MVFLMSQDYMPPITSTLIQYYWYYYTPEMMSYFQTWINSEGENYLTILVSDV